MNIVNDTLEIIKRILQPWLPRNLVLEELSGIYGNAILEEMGNIIQYYNIYFNGANFPVSSDDYVPSQLRFKRIKALIDKEARFMFANPIDIKINSIDVENRNDENISVIQNYVNAVLKENMFNSNLLKAAKDCFIGKRIAIVCNFNEDYGISISFLPSLEFIYDIDDYNRLNKIVAFYSLNDAKSANDQRIKKKKYWMENGYCHVFEGIYDGAGNLLETIIEDEETYFTYIPAVIIVNDGLSNDMLGESEVVNLFDYEQAYSKNANLGIDAEHKGMNPIYYTKDMTSKSTSDLSLAPGALWDLHSDTTSRDETSGDVGVLETNLNYSDPLTTTLNRIKDAMYEQIDMPSVTTSDLKGVVSSGKTLKAIYWGLIVRCDEKMMAWKYKLELLIRCLIDGAKLYPNTAERYLNGNIINDVEYNITIENTYPLPEDEADEKEIDLMEVSHKTRSIKSYLKKWENMTDSQVDEEIKQIALEKQILEESYFPINNPVNQNVSQMNEDTPSDTE